MKVEVLRGFGVFNGPPAYVPVGELLKAEDGRLYGYTREDGTNGIGTVFRFDPASKEFTAIKSLAPNLAEGFFTEGQLLLGSLQQDGDGYLYGITRAGQGVNPPFYGDSMFFRLKPDGSEFTSLKKFSSAEGVAVADGVLLAGDGRLYGALMTAGGIFRMNPDGSGFEMLAVPETLVPSNHRLVEGSDGLLYGASEQGLDIFRIAKDGSDFQTVVAPRGANVGVIVRFFEGSDGKLYVLQRGAWNAEPAILSRGDNMDILFQGSRVFRVDKDGSNFTVLFQFSSQTDLPTIARGMMAGSDGKLYITCESPDAVDARGAVFRINQDGSGYELLHLFKAETDEGRDVAGGVTEGSDGRLYGLLEAGMGAGAGGVYGLANDGSGYAIEHQCIAMELRNNWQGSSHLHTGDAAYPVGGVIDGGDEFLYGTTMRGGVFPRMSFEARSGGTVFKIRKDGSGYQILHSAEYGGIKAPLCLGSNGVLYGVNLAYGEEPNPNGFLFRIGRDVGTYERFYTFDGDNGRNPVGKLIEGPDGKLYGLTEKGGEFDWGVAYRLNKDGSGYEVIHHFQYSEGASFEHGMIYQSDGKIYGGAMGGGVAGHGTVFRMNSDGSDFEVVFEFGSLNTDQHKYGVSPPLLLQDNKLYGLTRYTSFYRMNYDGSGFEMLDALNGNFPMSELLQGSDNNFYFSTEYNVFRIDRYNRSIERLMFQAGNSPVRGDTAGQLTIVSPDEIYLTQTAGPLYDPSGNPDMIGEPGYPIIPQGGILKLVPGEDFGDAPNASQSGFTQSYPVTLEEDGARHRVRGPLLGSRRDAEKDGAHSASAHGDDENYTTGGDPITIAGSKEGVKLGVLRQEAHGIACVSVAGGNGKLDAWIDFNRDGDWDDEGEQVFQSLPIAEGDTWLLIPIPANAELGKTYARFRLSTAGGLSPRGLADDGEVEDYEVTISGSE